MALVNNAKKEINAKIVYFGPAGSGKSTALSYVYSRIKPSLRGELRSVPAGSDNLVFFDFSPFEAPLPNGFHLRLHVYTLTGNVHNPATWKMTLKGADGIMIMVNPAAEYEAVAKESVSQLREFLSGYGVGLHETPAVLQLNSFTGENQTGDVTKRAAELDLAAMTTCSTNAARGDGLLEALTTLSRQVLERITAKEEPAEEEAASVSVAPAAKEELFEASQPVLTEEPVDKQLSEASLNMEILPQNYVSEGRTIRIPIEISGSHTVRTLVVTVNVELE